MSVYYLFLTKVCFKFKTFFLFLNKIEFHHGGQAGLELLISGDPPTSAFESARIIGMSHLARPNLKLLN